MLVLVILIFTAISLKNFSVAQCLLEIPDFPDQCLECENEYFYNFSIPFQGGSESSFLSTECQPRKNITMNIEVFISPLGPDINSVPDGSPTRPFTRLFEGFFNGWKQANQFKSTILRIKLLGNGLAGDQESSIFFLDRFEYPYTYQFLFRTLSANISIEPAYCNLTFVNQLCIKNSGLKSIIYWRAESVYIFITKYLAVQNIIFDARDQGLAINESYKYKVLCEEQELEKSRRDPGGIAMGKDECGRLNMNMESEEQIYGMFNIEQRMNFLGVIEKPILNLSSVEVKYFLPRSKGYSIGCLVRMQRLGFAIIISNSVFEKNYFFEGMFSTSSEIPPHLQTISYIYATLKNDFEDANNIFAMKGSTISNINYYQVIESDAEFIEQASVFLKIITPTFINIETSQFLNNTGYFSPAETNIEGKFISYEYPLNGEYYYEVTNLLNLNLTGNRCKWFLRTKNVNYLDLKGPLFLYNILFLRNFDFGIFIESENIGEILIYMNGLYLMSHTLISNAFLKFSYIDFDISFTNGKISDVIFSNSSLADLSKRAIIDIFNPILMSDEDVFSVSRFDNEESFSNQFIKIFDTVIEKFSFPLINFQNYGVITHLEIINTLFQMIYLESDSLLKFSIEKALLFTNTTFFKVFSDVICDINYGRNFKFEKGNLTSIVGSFLKLTLWSGNNLKMIIKPGLFIVLPYSSFILRDSVFINNFFLRTCFLTEQVIVSSVYNFTILNLYLSNISGASNQYFLKSFFIAADIFNITALNINSIGFIFLESFESLIPSGKTIVYQQFIDYFGDTGKFLEDFMDLSLLPVYYGRISIKNAKIQANQAAASYFWLKDFYQLNILGSSFSSEQPSIKNARRACLWISTAFGFIFITNSQFFNLSSINGGALFATVSQEKNLYIKDSQFYNNHGEEMGGI